MARVVWVVLGVVGMGAALGATSMPNSNSQRTVAVAPGNWTGRYVGAGVCGEYCNQAPWGNCMDTTCPILSGATGCAASSYMLAYQWKPGTCANKDDGVFQECFSSTTAPCASPFLCKPQYKDGGYTGCIRGTTPAKGADVIVSPVCTTYTPPQ